MTDQDFVKDMHLLHQAKESSRTAKKVARKVPGSTVRGLPKKLRVLHQEARRLKISITFLPAFMKRHKENTTFFDYKRVMILWRCEFVFDAISPQDKKLGKIFCVPNVEDVKSFGELVSDQLRGKQVVIPDHLLPKRNKDQRNGYTEGQTASSSTEIRRRQPKEQKSPRVLEPDLRLSEMIQGTLYEDSGHENWVFLLRHEQLPATRPLFHRAAASDNLRRVLEYRDVLEFPSLLCLPSEKYLNDHNEKYPIYTAELYDTRSPMPVDFSPIVSLSQVSANALSLAGGRGRPDIESVREAKID